MDRPSLATWVGSFEMAGLYSHGLAQLPEGELTPSDILPEAFRQDYETLFEKHRQASADVPWSAFPLMLLPWLEAIAGCRIVHNSGNIWAEPCLDSYGQLNGGSGLQPRLDWLAPPFAGGYGWSVQNLWAEEPGGWFQDDAIAYWSPSLYRTHAFPRELKLSESIARTGCHLHSTAIFTVDELLKMPELGVIEINLDVVGKSISEMIPVFRRILEAQRLYVWGHFSMDDLVVMKEKLPTRGLALQLMEETPEGVVAMVQVVEKIWLG